ncbi:hypothetical protein [Streptomyces shaanxiensis]|uniref:Uncharacterized protein n=1 Tax=Streptomyces shaanxiensis TaxID=653357 RepID=A0ABP7WIC5_9ACTN
MRVKEQLTFGAEGLEGVALRFGLFYGPGGTDALLPMLRKRQLPVPSDHGRVLPWIDLTDAARVVVAAVERGRPGEAYIIADRAPMGFGAHVLVRGRGVRAAGADDGAAVADEVHVVRARGDVDGAAGVHGESGAGVGLDARVSGGA